VVLLALWIASAAVAAAQPARPPAARSKTPAAPSAFWFPLRTIWTQPLAGPPVGPPAFDAGCAYVALRDGGLTAVSLTTGGVLWTRSLRLTAPPAAAGGVLVAVTGAALSNLDPGTGATRWRVDLGAAATLTPLISPAGITVVTSRPEVLVLRTVDGAVAWRLPLAAPATTAPAADADHVYVGLADGTLLGITAATGAVRWTRMLPAAPVRVTAAGAHLLAGADDDFLYAVVIGSGRVAWRWRAGGDVAGAVALDIRHAYVTSLANSLFSLGRKAGDLKWERRLPSRPVSGPALYGDTLLLGTIAADLRFFAASSGAPAGTFELPGPPIHAPHVLPWNGPTPPRIVLLTAGGVLLSLGPDVEPPLVPLDPMPGRSVPKWDTRIDFEPPLVPMLYPPGRLLPPEVLPIRR